MDRQRRARPMRAGTRITLWSSVLTLALAAACSGGTHKPQVARSRPSAASSSAVPSTSAPAGDRCSPSTTVAGNSAGPEVNPPGDIPDNQAFVRFSPPTPTYSIEVPEGWARTDATSAVTFSDKFNAVRIELVRAPSAPTPASAQAQELPAVRANARCFEAGKVSTANRKGGTAVLITYRADAPPDPVTGKVVGDDVERYEFWRNGTEAVITLSGPQGSDNVDPWRRVTDSFAWT